MRWTITTMSRTYGITGKKPSDDDNFDLPVATGLKAGLFCCRDRADTELSYIPVPRVHNCFVRAGYHI